MRSNSAGWIYAAQKEGTPLVKLGYTTYRVDQRLKSIAAEICHPLALIGAVWIPKHVVLMERTLHAHLAAYRIQREWFSLHMTPAHLEGLVQQLWPDVLATIAADKAKALAIEARRQQRERVKLQHLVTMARKQGLSLQDLTEAYRKAGT